MADTNSPASDQGTDDLQQQLEEIEYTGAKDPADWSLAYLLLIPAMFLLFFLLLFVLSQMAFM